MSYLILHRLRAVCTSLLLTSTRPLCCKSDCSGQLKCSHTHNFLPLLFIISYLDNKLNKSVEVRFWLLAQEPLAAGSDSTLVSATFLLSRQPKKSKATQATFYCLLGNRSCSSLGLKWPHPYLSAADKAASMSRLKHTARDPLLFMAQWNHSGLTHYFFVSFLQ